MDSVKLPSPNNSQIYKEGENFHSSIFIIIMFSKVTCIIALFAAAFLLVKADQINIYSPPQSAEYHLKDVMDVRYKGNSGVLCVV